MQPDDIRRYRKELGLTQAQLSRELCVTRRALISWECGERRMPLSVEKLFCLLYSLPFNPSSDRLRDLDMQPDLFPDV
jgi:transcriptional regulator with XRE-family HTH domain